MSEEKRQIVPSKTKALSINLNPDLYGSFAEIGAGQEVSRHFFRAGGASGTVAKAMSAYDKDVSDAIYEPEPTGQYVCEPRLRKMIYHEFGLMQERLTRDKHPTKQFFSFADTVTTVNYHKTYLGNGWMGIRFQHDVSAEASDVIIHFKPKDNDPHIQQEAIGILGLNLIYGCFHYHDNARTLLDSLYDDLSRHRIEIDMVHVEGPAFEGVDDRLLSLHLVSQGMTDAVILAPNGKNIHPSQYLYKKDILVMRGSFRPVTVVNQDMAKQGYKLFIEEDGVDKENFAQLFEITLSNLSADGEIDEEDFLNRAEIINSQNHYVLISDYSRYFKLVDYLSRYKPKLISMIMGYNNLSEIFDKKFYESVPGGLLTATGVMFNRNLKVYLYPSQETKGGSLRTSKDVKIPSELKSYYSKLLEDNRVVDMMDYKEEYLQYFSREVIRMIKNGESGWEEMVPGFVDDMIKEKGFFGWDKNAASSDS